MPTPTPDELAVVARVLADLPAFDIVFDGPPNAQPGRFVEVELADTKAGVSVGTWVEEEPLWRLRIHPADLVARLAGLAAPAPRPSVPGVREQLGLMLAAWDGEVPDADEFIDGWAVSIEAALPASVLGPPATVEPRSDVLGLIAAGIIAFEHTREYVGEAVLPAIEGWSWYDWTRRAEEFLAAAEAPVHPRHPDPLVVSPDAEVGHCCAAGSACSRIFVTRRRSPTSGGGPSSRSSKASRPRTSRTRRVVQ